MGILMRFLKKKKFMLLNDKRRGNRDHNSLFSSIPWSLFNIVESFSTTNAPKLDESFPYPLFNYFKQLPPSAGRHPPPSHSSGGLAAGEDR